MTHPQQHPPGSRQRSRARRPAPEPPTPTLSRRAWFGVAAGSVMTGLLGVHWWRTEGVAAAARSSIPITVYSSPTCSCCHKWVAHLEDSGFRVAVENLEVVAPVKRKLGVPEDLWSCHTAEVSGYAVEGHVPADLIHKMLGDRPAFTGIAAPGMPNGSPGMEGGAKDIYEILAFDRSGKTTVYAVR